MKSKRIKRIAIFLIIVSVLMSLSYLNVRHKAEKIFHPFLKSELYYYGTQFMPFTLFYENKILKNWCGPNWNVSYDYQTKMTSGALSIRYNIFGNVIDTNPRNLLNEIIPNMVKFNVK